MRCISPNPRRVGYIDSIHEPLDGPLYMGSQIHQQYLLSVPWEGVYISEKDDIHIPHYSSLFSMEALQRKLISYFLFSIVLE